MGVGTHLPIDMLLPDQFIKLLVLHHLLGLDCLSGAVQFTLFPPTVMTALPIRSGSKFTEGINQTHFP